MDEIDAIFELESFDIYRGRSSGKSRINKKDDDNAREMFRNCLLLLDREKSVFDYDYYDGINNDTGYEWYVLKGHELEKALVLLKDIIEWERKHSVRWISGNLYKGDHIVIGPDRCLIRCDESCMPLKGTEAYERIKNICEENGFLIFSDRAYIDLFTGQVYMIEEESYPGSADDAATYANVSMGKIEGRIVEFEKERSCEELKFKWRALSNVRFAYQKAYTDNEIKDYLIRLEKMVGEEMITAYNAALSSADNNVKNLLKRPLKKDSESEYREFDELSDNTKEMMLHMLYGNNLKISYSFEQREIFVNLSEKVEETPGFTMIDLINFLENDEIGGFCNNIWRLKFHITYGSETCMSQWEKFILKLYPWIEQIEYVNKDEYMSKNPIKPQPVPAKAKAENNSRTKDILLDKKPLIHFKNTNEKTVFISIIIFLGIGILLLIIYGVLGWMK